MRISNWFGILLVFVAAVVNRVESADVVANFLTPEQSASGSFIWDDFNPVLGFPGNHVPSPGFSSGVGSGVLQPTAGGIITSSLNLYAFTSTPTYTFTISGAAAVEAYTNLRLQIATTDILTSSSFGSTPSEFMDRGVLSSLVFGGNPVGVNYYDVRWNGLAASSTLLIATAPATMHSVFGGAQFDYSNVSAVPEPTGFLLTACAITLAIVAQRRKRPASFQ